MNWWNNNRKLTLISEEKAHPGKRVKAICKTQSYMYTVHNHCTQRRAPGDPEVRECGDSSGRSPGRGPQRLDLLSGQGAHLATATRQSSGARGGWAWSHSGWGGTPAGGGASARPGVCLRITVCKALVPGLEEGAPFPKRPRGLGRPTHPSPTPPNNPAPPAGQRLTSREMTRALRARLPSTRENSLTWASPAATIHLTYWLFLGQQQRQDQGCQDELPERQVTLGQAGPGAPPAESRAGPGGAAPTPRGRTHGDLPTPGKPRPSHQANIVQCSEWKLCF